MRLVIAAAMAMTTSVVTAGELEDAHRLAISGRDSYWNCLAQEYTKDSNKSMSGEDFTRQLASVCPSERQNFRVTLVDYLSMQFPNAEFGSAYDDCQQRHRAGATGHCDHIHQAQGGEVTVQTGRSSKAPRGLNGLAASSWSRSPRTA